MIEPIDSLADKVARLDEGIGALRFHLQSSQLTSSGRSRAAMPVGASKSEPFGVKLWRWIERDPRSSALAIALGFPLLLHPWARGSTRLSA